MILAALKELAEREQLIDDPAFESKPVRWTVALGADGAFIDVYDQSTLESLPEGSKKKPQKQAKLMVIPRRASRTAGIKADFLVDKAVYALGMDADPNNPDRRAPECLAAFRTLLASASGDVPERDAVITFLNNDAERARCAADLAKQGGFASNDLFSFQVDGLSLAENAALRAWWGERQEAAACAADPVQCLVCGEHRAPARLHNSLQVRGASTSGVPLVSFNTDAFEKYGLCGNQNAPVCQLCMTGYTEALRRLTRMQYQTPHGDKLSPQAEVLTADTTAVYWSDALGPGVSRMVQLLNQPTAARDLLRSPRHGQEYHTAPQARFFCVVLTGVQGRISIRRLHTGTVGEAEANLARYFRAIHVERYDTSQPMPITRLLRSLVLEGKLDRLSGDLGAELWMHALFRTPLSRSFLSAVVARNRAERSVTAERAALLHVIFARKQGYEPKEDDHPMSLDRESKDQPYLLGRLLATLENLQTAAQGSQLNRTLVDRTFGAASTRPRVVFPQLIQTAQHHLSKAGKKLPGRAKNLDKLLGEITEGLNADGFSAVLSLDEQGRFALGYYHQRQSFFRGKDPNTTIASVTDSNSAEETAA